MQKARRLKHRTQPNIQTKHWKRQSMTSAQDPKQFLAAQDATRMHSGATQEAPRRHPGGTQEFPRKHPGSTQEAPRRHPELQKASGRNWEVRSHKTPLPLEQKRKTKDPQNDISQTLFLRVPSILTAYLQQPMFPGSILTLPEDSRPRSKTVRTPTAWTLFGEGPKLWTMSVHHSEHLF